jgi:sigma-B regulation protein RsbU (phosphoserine phosphatase)
VVAKNFINVPENFFTRYSLQLGSIVETLFLSLALADKFNLLKKELFASNIELENKIHERTKELDDVLKNLQAKDLNYEMELRLASDLQKCLIPSKNKLYPFIKSEYYYDFIMQVGGDFFDIIPQKDNMLSIYIADASGHGIPAALLSMMYKICFTNALVRYENPVEIFLEVNRQIEQVLETYDYLTAFLLIIEKDGNVHYSSAAHRPVFLFRKNKNSVEILHTKGMFLGMKMNIENGYESKETKLEVGDRILLFTDGVIEIENLDGWNSENLMNIFSRSQRMSLEISMKYIQTEWKKKLGDHKLRDDATLLLIEYTGQNQD